MTPNIEALKIRILIHSACAPIEAGLKPKEEQTVICKTRDENSTVFMAFLMKSGKLSPIYLSLLSCSIVYWEVHEASR